MSSPEMESFEVSENDLLNEFNPNRRTYKQSKNRATYGVWAEDSDEERKPGFGKFTKDYTAPIGFVSGGFKKSADDDKGENDENDMLSISDSDEEQEQVAAPLFPKKQYNRPPSSVPVNKGGGSKNLAEWERHTKGIGMKLLAKQGYVPGKGIGKNLQGIAAPVEARKRLGGGALGFYGSERTNQSLKDFPRSPTEAEEEAVFHSELNQWKGGESNKRKKPKYNYKTADDLIAQGRPTKKQPPVKLSHLANVKVIDLTGKEKRVLSGYRAMNHKIDQAGDEPIAWVDSQAKQVFKMPELLHNLDMLVDTAEEDILVNDRKLRMEKDRVVSYAYEEERLAQICEEEEKKINRMKEVVKIIDGCLERSQPHSNNPLTLHECSTIIKNLQANYSEEYDAYALGDFSVSLVLPLVKAEMTSWNPFTHPRRCLESIAQWRSILYTSQVHYNENGMRKMDPYERLIWQQWMPPVRTAFINLWNVRDCNHVIDFMEIWKPFLPDWVMRNIQDQLVLPRLQAHVDAWNPMTDTVPIHSWMHPWLPLIGQKMEPLYVPIRHKLSNALKNWHASDKSAKLMLEPWMSVWQKGHMEAFLVKNIMHKLGECLQELIINPRQQVLEPLEWVLRWTDMLPHACMVTLFDKGFFPKWHQVLVSWLNQSPNYNEVTRWYTNWKHMMPESLMSDTIIRKHFNKALDLMNGAVSGVNTHQPGARENIAFLVNNEMRHSPANAPGHVQPPPPPPAPTITQPYSSVQVPASYKELVQRKAEELGVLFMPIANRTHDSKQVYRLGNVQIYFDRRVIFMHDGSRFVPTSLQMVIERSQLI